MVSSLCISGEDFTDASLEREVDRYIVDNLEESHKIRTIAEKDLKSILLGCYTYNPIAVYYFNRDGSLRIIDYGCVDCSMSEDRFKEYKGVWLVDGKSLKIEVIENGKKKYSSVEVVGYKFIRIPGTKRSSITLQLRRKLPYGGDVLQRSIQFE